MATDLRAFVYVVEKGGFTEAAAELGLSPSAVSKIIKRLEDRLGVVLLNRTTRRQSLTPEGETFHLRARGILADLEDAETEVTKGAQVPRGRLRVNAMTGFVFHILPKVLPAFLEKYPEIEIDLAATDRIVDLLAANADIGIRSGKITDLSLHARQLANFERRVYASPAYLEKRGTPKSPRDLVKHECIVQGARAPCRWAFRASGRVTEFPVASRLFVETAETALRLAVAGSGLAVLADMLVVDAVRTGRLVSVLDKYHVTRPIILSAVYPQGRHRMPKVRVFIDFLIKELAGASWNTR